MPSFPWLENKYLEWAFKFACMSCATRYLTLHQIKGHLGMMWGPQNIPRIPSYALRWWFRERMGYRYIFTFCPDRAELFMTPELGDRGVPYHRDFSRPRYLDLDFKQFSVSCGWSDDENEVIVRNKKRDENHRGIDFRMTSDGAFHFTALTTSVLRFLATFAKISVAWCWLCSEIDRWASILPRLKSRTQAKFWSKILDRFWNRNFFSDLGI